MSLEREVAELGDAVTEALDAINVTKEVLDDKVAAAQQALSTIENRRYPGEYADDPLTRPDGSPSQPGDEYYNSSLQRLKFYTGSVWFTQNSLDNARADTVAGIMAELQTVADNAADVQQVANNIADVQQVQDMLPELGQVAINLPVLANVRYYADVAAARAIAADQFALSAITQANIAASYAAAASSVVQQDLSGALLAGLHFTPNNITDTFLYDTSRDSDAGAWVERCLWQTWVSEALNGSWLAAASAHGFQSELAARAAGATLGAEVNPAPAGDFAVGWTPTAGVSIVSGKLVVGTTLTTGNAATTTVPAVAGTLYFVSMTIESFPAGASGGCAPVYGAGNVTIGFNGVGTFTDVLVASSTGQLVLAVRGGNLPAGTVVSRLSVRPITALNTTSGTYYNLATDGKFYRLFDNILSHSDDLTQWSTSANDSIVSKTVTGRMDRLVISAVSQAHQTARIFPVLAGVPVTVRVRLKADNFQYVAVSCTQTSLWPGGVSPTVRLNLTDGSLIGSPSATVVGAPTITAVPGFPGEWYVGFTTATPVAAGNSTFQIAASTAAGASTLTGDGVSGIQIGEAHVRYGVGQPATYEAKGASGSSVEVFRGNTSKFPRLAGIVAEANSVTIYDLTQRGQPMWMRFIIPGVGFQASTSGAITGSQTTAGITAVFAYNGSLFVARNADASNVGGVNDINFIRDTSRWYSRYTATGSGGADINSGLAYRNTSTPTTARPNYQLAAWQANGVAAYARAQAPLDQTTGLPTTTLAVACGAGTNGGVTLFRDDGVVANITTSNTSYTAARRVWFDRRGRLGMVFSYQMLADDAYVHVMDLPSANTSISNMAAFTALNGEYYRCTAPTLGPTIPALLANASMGGSLQNSQVVEAGGGTVFSSNTGVTWLRRNPSTQSLGISAYVTSLYNTGGMFGDIRRCWISSSTAIALQGGDLSTGVWYVPATYDNVVSSATASGFTTTAGGTGAGGAQTRVAMTLTTVVGREYVVNSTFSVSLAATVFARENSDTGTVIAQTTGNPTAGTNFPLFFRATTTTTVILFLANPATAFSVSGYSVRAVVADRSFKARHIPIFGSVLMSAVATGSQLVAASGFSAANYLQEAYSADLDYGTGARTHSLWFNLPNTVGGPGNFIRQSENITVSPWSTSNVTLTADADGIFDRISRASGQSGYIGQIPGFAALTPGSYHLKLRAKQGSAGGRIGLRIQGTYPNRIDAVFDLVTGTIIGAVANGTASNAGALISAVGDGSYDLTVSGTIVDNLSNMVIAPTTTAMSVGSFEGIIASAADALVTRVQCGRGLTAAPYNATTSSSWVGMSVAFERSAASGAYWRLGLDGNNFLAYEEFDGSTTRRATGNIPVCDGVWHKARGGYDGSGKVIVGLDGRTLSTTVGAVLATMSNATAVATIGNSRALDAAWPGSLALVKSSPAIPSAEQAAWMFVQEQAMFQPGAQVCLSDAGNVLRMRYCQITDRLVVQTAANSDLFQGFRKVASFASSGTYQSADVGGAGVIMLARLVGSARQVQVSIPARNLQAELYRGAEAALRATRQQPTSRDFDAFEFTAATTNGSNVVTASSITNTPFEGAAIDCANFPAGTTIMTISGTTYYMSANATATGSVAARQRDVLLPADHELANFYTAGTLRREGSTRDYQRLYDGFVERVRTNTGQAANTWLRAEFRRIA